MLAASVLYSMRSEATAHTASVQREQAWTAAMSGVARALTIAAGPASESSAWQNNPAAFQHQFIVQDGDDQWYFTVYSASDDLGADLRFGLTDEAGKLSVLHADASWLARLPGLDADLAAALKGTAARPEPRPADSRQVTGASPFVPGPSLEECFAAAGLSSQLLFGEDANYNLRLDPNEDDADTRPPLDDGNGLLDRGLQQYLTTVSYDLNVTGEGRPRINLNDASADLSRLGLPQATLDYLAALHRAGKSLPHPAALLEAEGEFQDPQGRPVRLQSGIGREELANLLDQCTTTNAVRLAGAINVNTAPLPVLTAIPFIGEALADAIVAARPGLSADEARTPAWLYRRGLVNAGEFQQIAPYLTTRSRQFSFRSVGYAVPSGRYRVLAVTVDVTTPPGRVLALQDLTRFGFPVPLAILENGTSTLTAASAAVPSRQGAHPARVLWRAARPPLPMNQVRKAGVNPRTPYASRLRTSVRGARSVWSASGLPALSGSWAVSRAEWNGPLPSARGAHPACPPLQLHLTPQTIQSESAGTTRPAGAPVSAREGACAPLALDPVGIGIGLFCSCL